MKTSNTANTTRIRWTDRMPGALTMPALFFLAPMLFAPERLHTPAPWIAAFAWCVTLMTQPKIGFRDMLRAESDRLSALAILAAVMLAQFAAAIDYAAIGRTPAFSLLASSIGLTLVAAGLALRLWAIHTLGRHFSSTVEVSGDHQVVSAGPYRFLRHPSYTGALVMSLGVTLALQSPLGSALVVIVAIPAYLYRIHVEEYELHKTLGEGYATYAGTTWRLVPFVY